MACKAWSRRSVEGRAILSKKAVEFFGYEREQASVVEQDKAEDDRQEVEETIIASEQDENLKGAEDCTGKKANASRSENQKGNG